MSLESILDAMQDCVNINSESIGKGIEYMHNTGRAWFAISWNIDIKRYPKMFEDVTVKTWPYSFTSSMGYRNVIITDSDGTDILCADSIWSLVDANTGLPTKILEEDYTGYELEEKYPMEALGRKIKLPKPKDGEPGFERVGEHRVTKSDLDFNGHMTNGRYIKYADDVVPIGETINKVRVEYKSQSKYGEILNVEKYIDGDRWLVRFTGQDKGDVKAVVEFMTC
jgi:acyl-ACP thioesterase